MSETVLDTCFRYSCVTITTERLGVRLPPLKAAIFDRIKAAGDIGISSTQIITDLYFDRRPVGVTTIKAHISQLNDLFAGSDWRICSDRRRWFLHRRRQP
jgi:hypothetical protein